MEKDMTTAQGNEQFGKMHLQKIMSDSNEFHNQKLARILLVEDHRIASKVAKNILEGLNCQVDIAMDAKTAIGCIEKNYYDLVFMDIGLPDMNGYEATRRVRIYELKKGNHIPIVALSANSDRENQQLCLDAGMNGVLSKPLSKKSAEEMLDAFIPNRKYWHEDQNDTENQFFEEEIVDFDYAKTLLGDNAHLLTDILSTLVDSLPSEVSKLEAAYQQEDWQSISAIAHKLKGGASYCGTRRLKSACTKIENYIKSGAKSLSDELYQKLLAEIEALQKFLRQQSISA